MWDFSARKLALSARQRTELVPYNQEVQLGPRFDERIGESDLRSGQCTLQQAGVDQFIDSSVVVLNEMGSTHRIDGSSGGTVV